MLFFQIVTELTERNENLHIPGNIIAKHQKDLVIRAEIFEDIMVSQRKIQKSIFY